MVNNRPNRRVKNKRSRLDDSCEVTAEIYRKIISTGQVSEDDVNQLYLTWKPACQGCRVNTKDNPNCFCGLIPPPNGSRKSGLWQKTSEIVSSYGPDPAKDLREFPESPAGLTNLGATCYANSILQCLYMNRSFREGVFSVEPEILKQQPVLNQLARLFAQLHSSKMAFVDSAPFIQSLELDNSVQQDSHEFLTLLFSLLEQCLNHSQVSKARTMVQDLFRGGVSHVTICSRCGNQSESSSKVEDFYELELNVKGLKSLEKSLDDYLSVEELEGDNQFFCDSCATRVNATRRIMLRSLPHVLIFQLKRCVFLPNTTAKKKITSPFCFPEILSMERRLSENSQTECMYDLSAVLIHKGSAVNSGHYIAHVKDESTAQWWEFDDEQVINLGKQPSEGASSCAAKSSQPEKSYQPSPFDRTDSFHGEKMAMSQFQPTDFNRVDNVKTFTSSDAYMLMYVRRRSKNEVRVLDPEKMENGASSQQLDTPLPSHLSDEVEELNTKYLISCKQYYAKKEFEINLITERRNEVRSVLSEAPVRSLNEKYFWISAEWLRQWSDSIDPVNIDNTSIQCVHGKLHASKVNAMKRFSAEAWTMITSKYDGGPTLCKDDYCVDCLLEVARSVARADNYRDERMSMKEMAEGAVSGRFSNDNLYYVSKTWLQHWLRKKVVDAPCEADAGPTASIRCEHGQLLPEQADGAKRVLIPEALWQFLRQTALSVKPDDVKGCSAFSSDAEPCAECSVKLTQNASFEDNIREYKLNQKHSHEKLAAGRSIEINPSSRYCLLPSSWLSQWKSYVTSTAKNAAALEPDRLGSIIDSVVCEKHSRLVERPPELIYRRGVILQKAPNTDALTIIPEADWKIFCEDWGGVEAKSILAQVESDVSEGDIVVSCKEVPISEESMNITDEENNGGSRRHNLKTSPEVCEDCIGERESCELMRKLNFTNEDITVCFVHGKDPPKSLLKESGNILEPIRRSSKRSRKTNFGNSIKLNVSSSTSVYQLKMMLWEAFGIVKENQILHKGLNIIHGESVCLGDLNIFPGDTLWVTDSEIHENRDIADELSDQKMNVQMSEGGFRGTLLSSNFPPHVYSESCFNSL